MNCFQHLIEMKRLLNSTILYVYNFQSQSLYFPRFSISNNSLEVRIGLLVLKHFLFFALNTMGTWNCTVEKKQVPFSMEIGNVELMHECFPKHLNMGTAIMKWMNKLYFTNKGIDRDMSYKKIQMKSYTKSNLIKRTFRDTNNKKIR